MRLLKITVSLFCLSLLVACGNKGPVRPLEVPLPGTVQAPELRQQGDALLLGWQLPKSHQDGTPFTEAPVVDIYRMTFDPADDCPECFDRSTLLVSINPELPQPAQKIGTRYLLHDHPLKAGTGYQYKLIVRNRADEQSRPVILRQAYFTPVPTPQKITAIPHDSSLTLSWQAPALQENDTLVGYLIYRRHKDQSSPYPLNAQPLKETRFEEFSLENGTTYHYRIRALVKRDKYQIEGLASDELPVTPQAGI